MKSLKNKIEKLMEDSINQYYFAIHNANEENLSADYREFHKQTANIHYGRVDAFHEVLKIMAELEKEMEANK